LEENEALKNKFNKKVRNGKKAAASTGLKKSSKAETEEASGKHIESRKDEQLTSRIKTDNNEGGIAKIILQSIPPESCITSVKFEGPNIALYTKNPKFSLTELTYHLSSLSKILKKRFVIRTDPTIRLPEDQTRSVVGKLLPKDVLVSAVFCDDATGEVILEVNHPEAINSTMVIQMAESTGWIAHTRRSPHIPSNSINTIHSILKNSAKERTTFFQELGNRIFRAPLIVVNNGVNGGSDGNGYDRQYTEEPRSRGYAILSRRS
jgi:hypothetical protein